MKCSTIINKEREEEVLIYAHERSELVDKIEKLVQDDDLVLLVGYYENEIRKLSLDEIQCFFIEDNKVYAYVLDRQYLLKQRLYKIEEQIDDKFIKINQSCIANIKYIKKFESTIGGSLLVVFKNNYSDYISRRELKNVKKRLGI